MSVVMGIFVQATYALATFVHISNILTITYQISTKPFGPNFLRVLIFVDHMFQTKHLLTQIFFGPKIFCDQIFLP